MTERALTVTTGGQVVTVASDRRKQPVPWAAAEAVFDGSLGRQSERTKKLYGEGVKRLRLWALDRRIDTVTDLAPGNLVEYRALWQAKLDAGEAQPSAVSNRLVAARLFLVRCAVEGFLSAEMTKERIAAYLQSPKNPRARQLPTYLDRAEIKALLGEVHTARDRALLTLAMGSGLRVSELVGLRLGDLKPLPGGAAILEVRNGKGGKARSFRIPGEVVAPVRAWVEASGRSWQRKRDLDAWLFANGDSKPLSRIRVYQLLAEYGKAAAIGKPMHPHLLRHTFATHYMANGGNPVALAEILGHSSLNYVMTYAHLGDMLRDEGYKASWLTA